MSALLNSGAEINAVNNIGETVLMRHIRKSNQKSTPNTLQFLLDHGADPNICDTEGNSTLMEAINHDFYSAVSILVQVRVRKSILKHPAYTFIHCFVCMSGLI